MKIPQLIKQISTYNPIGNVVGNVVKRDPKERQLAIRANRMGKPKANSEQLHVLGYKLHQLYTNGMRALATSLVASNLYMATPRAIHALPPDTLSSSAKQEVIKAYHNASPGVLGVFGASIATMIETTKRRKKLLEEAIIKKLI
jgi:hypothetical protein